MNFSEPFIRKPVMTTLVMLTILLLGILSYFQLPVSNLPDVNYPTINVSAILPGASPETMANTIATPLEKEFMSISGITSVTSSSGLGTTSIILQFDVSKDINSSAQDVEAAITRAKNRLPANMPSDPSYTKVNPSDTPIIFMALTSPTMPPEELYTYANTFIGQKISSIEGVAQVITYGSPFALRIQVDPALMAARGITLDQVADSLDQNNPSLPTGRLDGKTGSMIIETASEMEKAEHYNPSIITYKNNSPIRIQDIGKAVDGLANDRMSLRYVDKNTNQPAVVLAVQRQPGANTILVAERIKKFLPGFIEELPNSIDLKIVFDRSLSIKESIVDVKFTLIVAFILVVAVIFLYLGNFTDTIIPSLAMPMSVVGTFIVMYCLNFSINNLSLLALTLAIGFIVDDAIVVLENIVRRVEEGESPWIASLRGSKQISFTIISMTISLVAVFIPMLFMGGLIGKIFQEFAITLAVVTLISGFISLTLTPMLCSLLIPPKSAHPPGRLARFSEGINNSMLKLYKPSLRWILRHRKLALLVGALSIIFSGLLFKTLPTDFIPDEDIGFIMAFNQAALGTSSEKMIGYQDKLVNAISQNPNIDSFVSIAAYPSFREGINFIKLKPHHERQSANEVIQGLYPMTGSIPGLNTYLKNIPLIDLSIGAVGKGAYQYALQGADTEHLYRSAENLVQRMRDNKLFVGVNTDLDNLTPQLKIEVQRDQAAALGITPQDVEKTLLLAFAGSRTSQIDTTIDQYDVILELKRSSQENTKSFSSIYIRSNIGKLIPLSAVAKWSESVGPASINHISQFPAVNITFSLPPGVALGSALEVLNDLAKEALHQGITGNVQGAAETFQSSLQSSGFLLLMAVVAIYIILGILYESFIHPLTILSTLPPAILGALITLYMFNVPLSLYAYLGIILLIGIVKKNGIMVVDFALENIREKGEHPETAIYNACLLRFRPIMMTTIAAIVGAIPIAMGVGAGAESRRPLGMVIIGGLIFSQLITLYLTPVIYLYLDKFNKFFNFKTTKDMLSEQA